MTELTNEAGQQSVRHDDLVIALQDVDSETSASEAHGVITGVLCVSSDDQASSKWVPLLLSDAAQVDAEAAKKLSLMLLFMHQNTHTLLAAGDFNFNLLLPDDDRPVAERIEALADWCRGYLLGMSVQGTGNQAAKQKLADLKKEFIQDLIEISNVQMDEASENEAEVYLLELHEFVRIGVQALFDEGQPAVKK
jgi:uncharacterized protein YgfB (UPF0149 family)